MPMPTLISALALLSGVALAAPSVLAQRTEPPPTAPPSTAGDPPMPAVVGFRDLDRNGDGKLSQSEAAIDAAVSRDFIRADQDGDGQLSQSEYALHHGGDHRD